MDTAVCGNDMACVRQLGRGGVTARVLLHHLKEPHLGTEHAHGHAKGPAEAEVRDLEAVGAAGHVDQQVLADGEVASGCVTSQLSTHASTHGPPELTAWRHSPLPLRSAQHHTTTHPGSKVR